jgi:putative membrane protein
MIAFIQWRRQIARGESPDTNAAPLFARISFAQAGLVILMVFAAAAMARGIGG